MKTSFYVGSFARLEDCPKDKRKVFAFVGRSNVGKSSLINSLCNKKQIAKTSNTPGKTKTLNYFLIGNNFYFVDMPGYGYAKVSKNERIVWRNFSLQYLEMQKMLTQLLVLVDISISPQKIDIDFLNFLGYRSIPFVIVFTKKDKTSQKIVQKNILDFYSQLQNYWEQCPLNFLTSSKYKQGIDDLLSFIQEQVKESKYNT